MKRKNKFLYAVWLAVAALAMAACSVDQHFEFPQGPKGDKGDPGLNAYQMWVEWINDGNDPDWTGGTSEGEFYLYFKGAKGDDGEAGQNPDPIDPNTYIPWINEETGTWWIGDVDTFYPAQGDQGPRGLSAYDYWVTQVELGGVTDPNTGEEWPTDMTTEQNFWEFLAAADGEQGIPGLSAYELWVKYIEDNEVDDPHNPGTPWNSDDTDWPNYIYFFTGDDGIAGTPGAPGSEVTLVDIDGKFYWHINGVNTGVPATGENGDDGAAGTPGGNGAPGLTAYQLWKADVLAGLIKVPYDESSYWPIDEVDQPDFWRYLRGRDGTNGRDGNDGKPGAPGTPDKEIVIQPGKPNVIAQYQEGGNSEFVSWVDGRVKYRVYDDAGAPAPNATVKDMPGMPDEEFEADEYGYFFVRPDQLPVGVDIDDRFGNSQVTYVNAESETVTETSAYNVYVPEKIEVRIRLTQAPVLYGNDFYVYAVVERRTEEHLPWERIPKHLGDLDQDITAYEVSDPTDPDSYDVATSQKWDIDHQDIADFTSLTVARPTLDCDYINDTYQVNSVKQWDGEDHYFTVVLDQYYGETPNSDQIVKVPPMQYIPILGEVSMSGYSSVFNAVSQTSGTFDVSDVDYTLLFERTFESRNEQAPDQHYFTVYEPDEMARERADAIPVLRATFTSGGTGGAMIYNAVYATLGNPTFNIPDKAVYVGSTVQISSLGTSDNTNPVRTMFRNPVTYGVFKGNVTDGFIIEGYTNSTYKAPTINVTYTE